MSHTKQKSRAALADGETEAASDFTNQKKLTAADIEKGENLPPRLAAIGKEIEAKVSKADIHQTKAGDMVDSIKELLVEAEEYCDEGGFNAFRKHYCPSLGKSRAYELLAIASGKKSVEQVKAGNAGRQAKHIAKLKAAATSPLVTESALASLAPGYSGESFTEAGVAQVPNIVPEQSPQPVRPSGAVKPKDDALFDFSARVLDLIRRTAKQPAKKFAATSVPADALDKLGQLLIEVANLKRSAVTKPSSMRAHGNDVENAQSAAAMSAAHQANEGKDAAASEAEPTTDDATDTENTPEDGRG